MKGRAFFYFCSANFCKLYNISNMASTNYVTPLIETVVLEVEAAILTASGENSFPHFGE